MLAGDHEGVCRALLSAEERDVCDQLLRPADRRLHLVAHALKRWVIAGYLEQLPGALCFDVGARGKPALAAASSALDLRFNLTHTSGLAALAVVIGVEIGIDAERRDRVINSGLAVRCFDMTERDYLCGLSAADRPEASVRFWTLKEAVAKACGKGIAMDLRSIKIQLDGDHRARTSAAMPGDARSVAWGLLSFWPTQQHRCAVAVAGELVRIVLHELGPPPAGSAGATSWPWELAQTTGLPSQSEVYNTGDRGYYLRRGEVQA